jgi:hypothetical protein
MMINPSYFNEILFSPPMQVPTATNQFFEWFFYGLGGIGGWLVFLLLGAAGVIWVFYDSQKRQLRATGWRIGVLLLVLLVLPTILYRFTVTPVHYGIHQILTLYGDQCPSDVINRTFPEVAFTDCGQLLRSLPPLTPYGEYVFYLGILGGLLAGVLAVGYYITFQGMVGCPQGHVYEEELGECPYCAAEQRVQPMPSYAAPPPVIAQPPSSSRSSPPMKPSKPTLQFAWLMDLTNNRRYDVCEGITQIGRSADNDIYLTDQSVSRRHVQIRETQGHCTLSDLGSKSGTLLNGQKLRNPRVLQNGDEIMLGDTVLKFVSSR